MLNCLRNLLLDLWKPHIPYFKVYAGGVVGLEDLANPANTTEYRRNGGNLYLHNSAWEKAGPELRSAILQAFKYSAIGIELGFNEGAEAWAKHLQRLYLDEDGIQPQFITGNCFDRDNLPAHGDWVEYVEALRTKTTLPKDTAIYPTFEYANFGSRASTLQEHFVSKTPDFRAIIATSKGIVIDAPPQYALSREDTYREWLVDAIKWCRARKYQVTWICSPHDSGNNFGRDAMRLAKYFLWRDAIPNCVVVENYHPTTDSTYPNSIGSWNSPNTILGVAHNLLLRDTH